MSIPGDTPGPPGLLWTPPPDVLTRSRLGHYLGWLEEHRGLRFADYQQLWDWSVTDLDAFWTSIWEYFAIGSPVAPALAERAMPGARWFPTVKLNYAALNYEP